MGAWWAPAHCPPRSEGDQLATNKTPHSRQSVARRDRDERIRAIKLARATTEPKTVRIEKSELRDRSREMAEDGEA